jgi:hypothetical protein
VLVEPTSHGYASGGVGTGGFSAETSLVLKQVEYKVLSEKGKNLGGPYKSKQAAEKLTGRGNGVAMDDGSCIPSRRYLRKLGLVQNWHFAGNKVWTR